MRITDWDDAYQNAAYIPGAEAIAEAWPKKAAAFRAAHPQEVLRHGTGDRQFLDLFRPERAEQGLFIFVHGGYWHKFSGRDFSHLAGGALARGYAVAVPTYTLAPEARIAEITAEVAAAVTLAAQKVAGPIFLAGHSAGGHLVSRMAVRGTLPGAVSGRVAHILSISGVHDLRPLLRTQMNLTLRIDPPEAARESPALRVPRKRTRLTCLVGAAERPEFLRQTDLLANIWTGLGADTHAVHVPGRHHFDVIDGLKAPDSAMMQLLFG